MDDFFGDMIDLRGPKSVGCAECAKEDKDVEMDRSQEYNHAVAGYIDVLRCPECGHEVLGGDEITTVDGERF